MTIKKKLIHGHIWKQSYIQLGSQLAVQLYEALWVIVWNPLGEQFKSYLKLSLQEEISDT